jgi:hypothetical protein
VFIAESGQPVENPFDRNFIAKELNVLIFFKKIVEDSNSRKIPLLYSILFGLKKEFYQPKNNIPDNDNIPIRYKEQTMTYPMNNNSVNISNNNKPFIDQNDQPKPWIID